VVKFSLLLIYKEDSNTCFIFFPAFSVVVPIWGGAVT